MVISTRLQMLTCLVLYASCAHAIMVKFGTRQGPIEPPPPAPAPAPAPEQPQPAPQPARVPAPVWEERSYDKPDPNAQWRPQPIVPQPRYTHVAYYNNQPTNAPKNAQEFVSAYIPINKPIQAQPIKNYFTPGQILSSQSLPGFGIRYFIPAYITDLTERKNIKSDDDHLNHIERNEIADATRVSAQDEKWNYEKEVLRRHGITSRPIPYQYKFPEYVAHQ